MIIRSPEEMIDFGYQTAQHAEKVLLYGDLGAGKTHFTRGFARALGIDYVHSPTYTYLNEYDDFIHIDMYRLEDPHQLINKGVISLLQEKSHCCVEWPKFEDLYVDEGYTKIWISKVGTDERLLKIDGKRAEKSYN